jgi:hypothetical protein
MTCGRHQQTFGDPFDRHQRLLPQSARHLQLANIAFGSPDLVPFLAAAPATPRG